MAPVIAMSLLSGSPSIAERSATVIASKSPSALNLLCPLLTTDWFKAYPQVVAKQIKEAANK